MDTQRLRIHVISENELPMKGQGVYTAFVDCADMLKSGNDLDCVVNQEGWGDVLHSHTYGPYYLWKGLRYRGRRILTVHVIPDSIKGSLPAWRLLMPFVRWYLRRVYSFTDVCIAISPMVEEAIRSLKVKTRIVRINNPIHTEKFRPTTEKRAEGRRLLNVPPDAFVVLGVGQLEHRKGVEDFLDIAGHFPDLAFVWVGGRPFGPLTEGIARLNHRIAEAAHPRIKFIHLLPLDQMPLIYSAADLLLFPSFQENSPLVPVEAAAAGLPVIYRDLPEYERLYRHPYLKAKTTDAFVALIKRIRDDPEFRRKAREISRVLISQFDKKEIRRQLVSLYREVFEKNRMSRC
jgi:1,2-diacylglycerol-3-alpha-glucose alpha-1,2-galactosyltransferase